MNERASALHDATILLGTQRNRDRESRSVCTVTHSLLLSSPIKPRAPYGIQFRPTNKTKCLHAACQAFLGIFSLSFNWPHCDTNPVLLILSFSSFSALPYIARKYFLIRLLIKTSSFFSGAYQKTLLNIERFSTMGTKIADSCFFGAPTLTGEKDMV